jgi:hypothetical protein
MLMQGHFIMHFAMFLGLYFIYPTRWNQDILKMTLSKELLDNYNGSWTYFYLLRWIYFATGCLILSSMIDKLHNYLNMAAFLSFGATPT